VLTKLRDVLTDTSLSPADLVNVRGSLRVEPGASLTMDAWNAAWADLFSGLSHRPTRTTLGAVALAGNDRVQAEAVAAYWPDHDAAPRGRATLNPFVRTLGDGPMGSSAAVIVHPGAALIFSAGALADPADLKQPEGNVARFGDMRTQAISTFRSLEQTLLTQGFRWEDVFYVRALLSPIPSATTVDFAGFETAFRAAFMGRDPAMRPALTAWAAPGFSSTGRIIEIEVYAAAADGTGPFDAVTANDKRNPWMRMSGTPESRISSSGAVARHRPITWFAGVIGTAGSLHDEAVTTLLTLRQRAAAAGVSLADAVQLRAYPVVGDDFSGGMSQWNEAYDRFFNLPGLNPHKPARTAFPVTALPMERKIEIEIIAVPR
jgi:enamine deaminase RidA (YjgF/YER057c/UK114 family)